MASNFQIVGVILLLCVSCFGLGWAVRDAIKDVAKYIPTELAPTALLYVLYDERGLVHECNDGRISRIYTETP